MTSLVLHVGTKQESGLFDRFRGMLISAGQIIGCDEKVFEYDTATSHMVRVVPAKKQVGLWNYTMCVWLDNSHTFCIYSRCHTEIVSLDEHITMPELISEQIRVAKELQEGRAFQSCLVWDSYYLTQLCVQMLRAERIPYIAAINPQRFGALCSTVDRFVTKVGDMAFAVKDKDDRREREELLTLFHSPDNKKGRRFTLGNYLVRKGEKRRKGHIPNFDEYEISFNVCDIFNRSLHDKSWPHRYSGKSTRSDLQAGSDFLFTVALVNIWNYWKALKYEKRLYYGFEAFCTKLALQIMAMARDE